MPFISSIRRNFEKPATADSNANRFKVSGGDSIITAGGYRIHMFTSVGDAELFIEDIAKTSNTMNLTSSTLNVEYLVIAGGGGAGGARGPCGVGAGGAGGYRVGNLTLPVGSTATTVGAGGTGWLPNSLPASGQGLNSVLGSITSLGGGTPDGAAGAGRPGGSGGGSGYITGTGGAGTVGQGNAGGGAATSPPVHGGSGGGGAGAAGINGVPTAAGAGGAGLTSSITGTTVTRGGGGGAQSCGPSGAPGGSGGGGPGHVTVPGAGSPGVTNTGGGAGTGSDATGGNGGPGLVVVRYTL